jgi:hypothetical protein
MSFPCPKQNSDNFAELRSGYWDVIFHTDLDIALKRGFATYFRAADDYVVQNGGVSIMGRFNATCENCGFDCLILKRDDRSS